MPSKRDRFGVVRSLNHPHVRRIRELQARAERERTGLFYVEGVRFVARAAQQNADIETLVVAPPMRLPPFARTLARQIRDAGIPCLEVTPEVFRALSRAEEPQGIGVVVRQWWEPLERIWPSRGLCWVALESVHSPGNLGTILRTGEAVGAGGMILLGDAVDPYDPGVVRASMGALFSQQLVRTSLAELLHWKRWHQCLIVGTSPAATVEYDAAAYPPPVVLFMGPERHGLSREHQAACDLMVRIPMAGEGDSLNLAVATGVMLYELFRRHRRGEAA